MSRPPARKPRSSTAARKSGGKDASRPGLGLKPPSIGAAFGNRELGSLLGSELASNKEPLVSRVGGSVALTVFFGQDDFFLDVRSANAVRALGGEIKLMIEPTVTVEGHASTEGKEDHNLKLSKMRRELVVALLAAETSPATTFGGAPHGESDPMVAEAGEGEALEEKRACNRRVEVVVVPKPFEISPEPEEYPDPVPVPIAFPPGTLDLPSVIETDEERLNRMIREGPIVSPERPKKSLEDWTNKALDNLFNGMLKGVIKDPELRRDVSEKLRDGVKAGGKKAFESVIDGTDISDEAKEAVKKGVEGGFKQDF